jgi:hypothetical protein
LQCSKFVVFAYIFSPNLPAYKVLHCCYPIVTLLLHCCYTAGTLLLHCCCGHLGLMCVGASSLLEKDDPATSGNATTTVTPL